MRRGLDELVDYGLVDESQTAEAKEILGSVGAMLIGLLRSLETRESIDMAGGDGAD